MTSQNTPRWLDQISPCVRPIPPSGETIASYTNNLPCSPRWLAPLRVIYDHELILFDKSDFLTEIEEKPYPCPRGSFIIIPPGRWHVIYNTGKQTGHHYFSHFDWINQGPYGQTPILTYHPAKPKLQFYRHAPDFVPKGVIHGTVPNLKRAIEIQERLSMMQVYGSQHEKHVSRALLLELLLELLDGHSRTKGTFGEEDELVNRVRTALEHAVWNLPKVPPIRELLEKLGYSYAHLCRLFRARYGIAPLKYIHALQITRAKMLLLDTDLSVAEIAYRVGFDNPTYFALLFRKMTRLSPTAFKSSKNRPGKTGKHRIAQSPSRPRPV